jgi:putative tricarboxylic transport membrane protein
MKNSGEPDHNTMSDRIAAAIVIVVALLVALEARTFTVGFVTDPLGPKAFPLVSAFLLLVGGVALQFRPVPVSNWPTRNRLLYVGGAFACLLGYALLLEFLGFFSTTLLAVCAFSLMLGGRPLASLATGASTAALLYVLFFYLLDIALPLGSLFVRGG